MRRAEVESRRNFDAPRFPKLAEEFEAALEGRTISLQSRGESRRNSGRGLGGLDDADPRVEPGPLAHAKPLLEANLRLPKPQVAGPGQRRDPHLRQRSRLARGDNRFVLRDGQTARLPIQGEIGSSEAHRVVGGSIRAAEKIHEDGAMNFPTPKSLGTAIVESENGLPPGGPADSAARRLRGDGGIVRPTVQFGIVESVDQRHPGEPDGEAL